MGEGEREVGGEGEGEGESLVGEVGVVLVRRRGREVSSEVVEVGDSGLSCFKTTSILCLLLLLLLLRIASIEKQPRLLFSPIFFLEHLSSWKEHLSSTGLLSGIESFYSQSLTAGQSRARLQ